MKITLEVPDHKAAFVLELLNSLPFVKTMQRRIKLKAEAASLTPTNAARLPNSVAEKRAVGAFAVFGTGLPELSKAEQRAILAELAKPLLPGEETAEEMIARIYGDRRDAPREVEL